MQIKRFQRCIESFSCENCGNYVEGDGYTNHCPRCLWSKHVDINPGDRASTCHGLLQPEGILIKGGEYIIQHRCLTCGEFKKIRSTKRDNFETILSLAVG